ncbi:MAG: GPR1/FUN34/YaaH family transporter [Christensenellaceae bacterium]|nr:GPR1/FUN34/YaaH family transporter [Christensenellaceae bacterium]
MSNTTPQQPKDWANPTPAGLVALAAACMCFFALLTGSVTAAAMPLIGCWLLGGFLIQVIVGLMDLKGGNHTGGNTFLFFSAFFMFASGLEMFFKYSALQAGAPLDGRVDGFVWLALTIVMLLWTPAFFTKFSLLSIIVVLVDIALPFIALTDLGVLPKSFSLISAYSLLGSGAVAVYLSAALVVNTAFGKKVYPLP